MRRNKHLRPELREQYARWEQEFMAMHRKKHTILFLIWLIVWLAFAACVLFLEPNIIISFCFMRVLMKANTRTVGMMAMVRVSFTMVAKSPAASEKA